jgi:hypothetical protein
MENIDYEYSEEEKAWVSPEITLQRNIYLMINLKTPGKVIVRQSNSKGESPRVPIKKHHDTSEFAFRIRVIPDTVTVQIFTSTEPKEIKYAYI